MKKTWVMLLLILVAAIFYMIFGYKQCEGPIVSLPPMPGQKYEPSPYLVRKGSYDYLCMTFFERNKYKKLKFGNSSGPYNTVEDLKQNVIND